MPRVASSPASDTTPKPSGRLPSTAFTPRFVSSQAPPEAATIPKGTVGSRGMTRTSAPVAASISVTELLSTLTTQARPSATVIASGPFS